MHTRNKYGNYVSHYFLNILADSEQFVDQWFMTNPRKTEETFGSIQIGTSTTKFYLK
jgi:hypothetical protein